VALAGTLVPLLTLLAYVALTAGVGESLPALGVASSPRSSARRPPPTRSTGCWRPSRSPPARCGRTWTTSGGRRCPTELRDDAGLLMAGTQRTIEKLDEVIVHLASYDRLTALPNRALFRDRLQQAVAQARREARPVTVILLDVDGFADVNTAWGQAGGDRLLAAVAQRLATCTRESDVLARVGGDEFAIASIGQPGADPVDVQARRVVEAMSRPFNVEGREVVVSASVGVTVFPTDDGSVEQLLGNASAAARAARRSGGNTYRFYSAELNARLQRRLALETDLRHALERGQLFLHYQPKVEAATGRVRGVEALARWHHPERGLVPPMEFIPIARRAG
jgi:diguanylate cyclase (GGDEF)-like protein